MLAQPVALLTLGGVARHFGIAVWQVRRLYERGLLPPAARVGQARVVAPVDLPTIEAALRRAGYLPGSGHFRTPPATTSTGGTD